MPKIDIDELCEPIEITVGGKTYIVEDISRETAKKMARIKQKADDIQAEITKADRTLQRAVVANDIVVIEREEDKITALTKKLNNIDDIDEMSSTIAELIGADKADIAKLGIRKIMLLIVRVMGVVNEEIEGKNVPKAEAVK